jgi:Leucine-rich repeat (LRR) protein
LTIVHNSFDGPPPNLANNLNIRNVNIRHNKLSGTIPGFANLNSLRSIYLQSNVLTRINAPGSLPALVTYQAQNNSIEDQVPDFSGCNNLRSLVLNNNKFYSYKIGAVAKNYKLNYLDLSFNNLSSTALDNILVDLLANWTSINRGRVTINLKNQTSASNNNITMFPSQTGYAAARVLVSKGWSIGLTGGIPDEPEII